MEYSVHSVQYVPASEMGPPPPSPPLPQASVPLPPGTKRGAGTLACGLGGGGVPIPTTGEKA
jgi:hypothetical protein